MNFFLALISLSLFHSIESASDVCADGQFACNDGRCITNDWVCDGARDCSDGSDEHHEACDRHMNKNSSCFGNQPECKKHGLARCIPHEWLCDGHPDCDAGEDEYNCTSIDWFRQPESLMRKYQSLLADKSTTTQYFTYCAAEEFRCESSGNCLKLSQLCDGKLDCGKGEDEKNCTKKTENGTNSTGRNTSVLMSTTTKLPVTTSRLENITLNSLLLAKPSTLTTPTSTRTTSTTTASTTTTTTTPPKTTTTESKTETTKAPIIHIQPTLPSSSYVLPTTRSSVPTTTSTITTQKVVARTFATQLHTTQPPKIVVKLLNDSWSNSTADKEKQKGAAMTTRASSATEISRYGRKGIGEPVRFVKGIPIEPVNRWNATDDDFE